MKLLIQFFIALIPLVYSNLTSDPTLSIRFFVFSIFTSLLLFFQLFNQNKFSFKIIKHPLFICLIIIELAFLFSSIVNGFSAEALYLLLKFFNILVFTLIITSFLASNSFKDLLISLLFFSFFSSIFYIFQLINSYETIRSINDIWHRNKAFDNIFGSMGNKNLLASIQFLLLPAVIYLTHNSKKLIKYFALLTLLLISIIFFQTQSRAVFGAILISSIVFLFVSKISFKYIYKYLIAFSFILIVGFSFLYSMNRLETFKKEITNTINFSSSQRFSLYKSTLNLIYDNPFFGVGPGNWKIKIWEYDLYHNTFGNSFAQRPHNDFLWVFSEGGIFAGLSYLLIFIILLKDSYYLYNKSEDTLFFRLVFSILFGYFFISMLDFPLERFSHIIVFFLFAAIIVDSKLKHSKPEQIIIPKLLISTVLLLSFFTIYTAFLRFNGDINTSKALKFRKRGNWRQVVKAIDNGYNKNYYNIEGTSTPLLWYRGIANFYQKKYDSAFKDFKQAYLVNPNHIHVLNNLATSYETNGDISKAKEFYYKSLEVSPTFKESRVNLAAILYNDKKYVDALDVILQSKIDLFWRRVRDNDNYDLYLKTIFSTWVNDISSNLAVEDLEMLNNLVLYFQQSPASAERKLRATYIKRIALDLSYIQALVIIENEIKTHDKFKY